MAREGEPPCRKGIPACETGRHATQRRRLDNVVVMIVGARGHRRGPAWSVGDEAAADDAAIDLDRITDQFQSSVSSLASAVGSKRQTRAAAGASVSGLP